VRIDFNIDILNRLVYEYPERVVLAKSHFSSFDQWLAEKQKPTVNQLAGLAHLFQIPFGYFFLSELPVKEYPIPHFRTQASRPFSPSQELFDTVETLMERQQWARDILLDWRETKLNYADRYTKRAPIVNVAQEIRKILNTTEDWARTVPNWTEALRLLVEKAEAAGIFVVMNGVVDNNNQRKLDVNEFRGFVLHDDYAPFVFINNNDAVSGKIFTLIHEIAHILLGKSASFDLRHLQPADSDVEQYCNAVAAEFLVPQARLKEALQQKGINYELLARMFKVSQIVITRRLLDLGAISKSDFFAFYDNHIRREYKQKEATGGNFYNTVPYRISKRFFRIIHSALKENKLLYTDAFRLTNLKPKTFDQYIKKHLD
jgi:Zn-dependent peptidase ImmA (M78 family)/transcriptional regulator with XRE-family HTH domain